MSHKISHAIRGFGNTQTVTPECSCGWKGIPEHAYTDGQMYQVKKQCERHLKNPNIGHQSANGEDSGLIERKENET